ncbi:MAG: hypothetical protein Q9187_001680 [Circinaria calcarea]
MILTYDYLAKEVTTSKDFELGRIFIKLAKLTLKSATTGETVKANIITNLPGTNPGKKTSLGATTNSSGSSPRLGTNNAVGSPPRPQDGSHDKVQPKTPLTTRDHNLHQRTDIDRILKSVTSLQVEVTALHNVVAEIQENQAAAQKNESAPMGETRPEASRNGDEDLRISNEQVTRAGNKASEIDELKAELESVKRRIARLEETNSTHSTHSTPDLPHLPNSKPKSVQTARRTGSLAQGEPLIAKSPLPSAPVAEVGLSYTKIHDLDRYPATIIPSSQPSDQSDSSGEELHISTRHRDPSSDKLNREGIRIEDRIGDAGNGHDTSTEDLELGTIANIVDQSQDENMTDEPNIKHSTLRRTRQSVRKSEVSKLQQELAILTADGFDDSEDTDYRPRRRSPSSPRGRGELSTRGRNRGGRPRHKKLRLATPPWEKPDWNGPEDLQTPKNTGYRSSPFSSRGRNILRRGLSGGLSKGSATKRRKISSEEYTEDGRQRDEEGYLLRWDGQRDRRSLRGRGGLAKSPSQKATVAATHSRSHEKLMGQIFPERRKSVVDKDAVVKTED